MRCVLAAVVGVVFCVAVGSLVLSGEHTTAVSAERASVASVLDAAGVRQARTPDVRVSGGPVSFGSESSRTAGDALDQSRMPPGIEAGPRAAGGEGLGTTAAVPPRSASAPRVRISSPSTSAHNRTSQRSFVTFIHVPKMGGTSLRKLFCELRTGSWLCPFPICANPAGIISSLERAPLPPWAADARSVFLEQHCMDDLPMLIARAGRLREPLRAHGLRLRTLLLLREPVATAISWFWFFNPTQGPLLPTLEAFARLRPEFVGAELFHAYDRLPRALSGEPELRAAHADWASAWREVKAVQSDSNLLLETWAAPLPRALRIGARTLAVARADAAAACAGAASGGEACGSARARIAAAERFVWDAAFAHHRAGLQWSKGAAASDAERAARAQAGEQGAWAPPSLPRALRDTLADATRRYTLELRHLERQRDLIAALGRRGRAGCDAVNRPLHAAIRTLDHVLLTDSMRAHVDRLLALLGQPEVGADELRGRKRVQEPRAVGRRRRAKLKGLAAGGSGGRRRLRAAERRRLQPPPAIATGALALAPQHWKSEREDRFVFNPSYYAPTSNATRALLAERSPCAIELHRYWARHAPATLGLGDASATGR